MKIRFLVNYKHKGIEFGAGDVISFLDEPEAKVLVQHGFAEDVDGIVSTGVREKVAKELSPEPLKVVRS